MSDTVITKTCIKCKQTKPLSDYSPDKHMKDKHYSVCKSCVAERTRNHYWLGNGKKTCKRYRHSEKGRKTSNARVKKHNQTHPERANARRFLSRAIISGKINHPTDYVCNRCFKPAECYHHFSYAKEHLLRVIPFCTSCHHHLHAIIQ